MPLRTKEENPFFLDYSKLYIEQIFELSLQIPIYSVAYDFMILSNGFFQ